MTTTTNTRKLELLSYLHSQRQEVFSIAGRIDRRRYLPREFPASLPVLLSLQAYPDYRQMIGENWMHWHDYYEFWVATAGSGVYRAGPHQFPFATGDIVLVDPLKLHGVLRMNRAHAPLVVFFRADCIAPTGSEIDREFLAAWDRRPEKIAPRLLANAPAATAVHAAVLRLAQTWFERAQSADDLVELKFHLLEVLLELRRGFLSSGHTPPDSVARRADRLARLSRVLEFVGERCHMAIPQPEVARFAGMSTSRFRAFFKETTGWGFADYVRDLRLERAARLLRETVESVAAVAYQTGFADQSHLQRLFKAKYDVSPLAYRRRHQSP